MNRKGNTTGWYSRDALKAMTTPTTPIPTKNVLLLRTPAEGGLNNFENAFNTHGYLPTSVPVLETIFVNVEDLSSKIAAGPQNQSLSGVIVTSKRGMEAWSNAVKSIVSADPGLVPGDSVDWSSVLFYAIEEATASATAELRAALPSRLVPGDTRGQAQSGTAEKLAHFISSDLSARADGSTARRLLYLTGDKNHDTLPNILTSAGIVLNALRVYATHGSPSFLHDLKNVIENVQADVLKLHVDVVAPRPTSRDLASAISAFDRT